MTNLRCRAGVGLWVMGSVFRYLAFREFRDYVLPVAPNEGLL